MHRRTLLVLFASLIVPSAAVACLWDYDTIKMERSRFPDTLELITGKFLRHTPEFYQWRIEDRLKKLESDPSNPRLLDDLAAAYDKTGQHEKAIETALRTEKLHPGRYETAANLGTFYIHAGRLQEGLPHIEKALRINPDAHFGREKYQKLLVEYVIERRKGGPLKLPLAEVEIEKTASPESPAWHDVSVKHTFADFVIKAEGQSYLTDESRSAAVKGILGMMRFGKHDSPVLLEALASLLAHGHEVQNDARLLAARALLRASDEVPEGPSRTHYRALAAWVLQHQTIPLGAPKPLTPAQINADFQNELAEGRAWYADLREKELGWIRDGKNPEAEFDRLYDADPVVSGMDVKDPMSADEKLERGIRVVLIGLALAAVAVLVGAVFLARRLFRSRPSTTHLISDRSDTPSPSSR